MTLIEMIIAEFPELANKGKIGPFGPIILQNDGDGDYIVAWNYSKPVPTSLKAYDRT